MRGRGESRGRSDAERRVDRFYNRVTRAGDPALAEAQRIRNSVRWKKLRHAYRLEHPMCELCRAKGRLVPAREVDHKVPLELAPELGLEWDNLQALCRACHALKTAAEVRAKGDPVREQQTSDGPASEATSMPASGPAPAPPAHPDWALARVLRHLPYGTAAELLASELRSERVQRFGPPLKVDVGGSARLLSARPGDVVVITVPPFTTDGRLAEMRAEAERWCSHLPVLVMADPIVVRVEKAHAQPLAPLA